MGVESVTTFRLSHAHAHSHTHPHTRPLTHAHTHPPRACGGLANLVFCRINRCSREKSGLQTYVSPCPAPFLTQMALPRTIRRDRDQMRVNTRTCISFLQLASYHIWMATAAFVM